MCLYYNELQLFFNIVKSDIGSVAGLCNCIDGEYWKLIFLANQMLSHLQHIDVGPGITLGRHCKNRSNSGCFRPYVDYAQLNEGGTDGAGALERRGTMGDLSKLLHGDLIGSAGS